MSISCPPQIRPRRVGSVAGGFIDKQGLRALSAANEVIGAGPLRAGPDGQFWAYEDGVWSPGEDEVHARIVDLLEERYRRSHDESIRAVVRRHVPRIDCEPVTEYINFANGLLDWRTGELGPHRPDVPSTVQLTIPWDPDAHCPDFDAFLIDVIQPDDLVRVWEIIGYLMMSGNPLHKAFMLAGTGRNGKGAFLRTVTAMLGAPNVSSVSLHALSANRFATAQLFGRLANICGDIDATYIEDTGRIKEITGQDQVMAEHKYGQPFMFTAWCSMLFSANEIPGSADGSTGWADRWEVVRFSRYVGDRVDDTLEPRLQSASSLAGIAARAIPALQALMARRRFIVTTPGRHAKDEFERKSNPVKAWIEECVTLAPEAWENRTVLYANYKVWTEEAGLRPMSKPKFYDRLHQVPGVTAAVRTGARGYSGLSLAAGPGAGRWR